MNYNEWFIETDLPAPLSRDEISEHVLKAQNGDIKSRNTVVMHNVALIMDIINKYFLGSSCEKKELVSVGITGLYHAIEKFDVTKGFRFSSYASICIKNEIKYFLKIQNNQQEISLYSAVATDHEGNELLLKDILVDSNADFILECEQEESILEIRKQIDLLPERNKEIIKLYFGFYNDKQYTQKQIGQLFGLSRARISLLIIESLEMIKNNMMGKKKRNVKKNKSRN